MILYFACADRIKDDGTKEQISTYEGTITEEEAAEAWNRRAEQTGEWLIGEWLEDEYGYCRCSICGYEHDGPETTTPYCPNCGAKMESEDK